MEGAAFSSVGGLDAQGFNVGQGKGNAGKGGEAPESYQNGSGAEVGGGRGNGWQNGTVLADDFDRGGGTSGNGEMAEMKEMMK